MALTQMGSPAKISAAMGVAVLLQLAMRFHQFCTGFVTQIFGVEKCLMILTDEDEQPGRLAGEPGG
ncbi:MAG TPA: hypothetical protein VHZ25_03255 [Acidobacteriaceae bacterium]|jgi:hypothetical protein|nr:hypothetical protein [Acidobacteriaceae bacterium]